MQLTCPHCQAAWEFTDRRPAFCPFCGKSLPPQASTLSSPSPAIPDPEAPTLAAPPRPAGGDQDADPETIGGYRLLRVLGVGGMGKVYEAEDITTGRRVALKLVSADYAAAPDAVERFRREGRLASLIAHPRCVFVLAADEDAGRPYIVMELMPGDTLGDYVRRNGPQSPARALAMILDAIEGLQEAHRVGVVHRDMKPSNCFFGHDGRLKVGDFGLSKSLAQGAHLTKTGSFLGTPWYASPEQVRGEALDAQSDVYSTAATLYYLLTGRAPFQSDNAAVTLARIAADSAPSLRTLLSELPPELDAVVLRGLERDRKRRWQNLDEFAEALRPFLPGQLSLAGLGIRFGAYAIDYGVLVVFGFVVLPLELAVGLTEPFSDQWADYRPALVLFDLAISMLYFFVPEALGGRSPGKWLLELRVREAPTNGRAPWPRVLLRTTVFLLLTNLGMLIGALVLFPLMHLPEAPTADELEQNLTGVLVLGAVRWLGFLVGVGLLLGTMRSRNGWRGLHEFVSGTRVVLRPRGRQPSAFALAPPEPVAGRSADVPEKVGRFAVRGVYRWDGQAKLVTGVDAALGRQVVLWLRPAAAAELSAARRDVNRITRLRWLAAGREGDWRWDAFIVPDGCPLPALIDALGPLDWQRFLPLLKQLTDELTEALSEGTVPSPPGPGAVWVRSDGRLVLLDVPLTEPPPEAAAADAASPFGQDGKPEKVALALLGETALLALEGRRPSGQAAPARVRAPLPLAAGAALARLLGSGRTGYRLRDFQGQLAALEDKPAEVTHDRRARQLAVLALFQLLALGWLLPVLGLVRFGINLTEPLMSSLEAHAGRDQLDQALLSDALCDGLNPHPLFRLRTAAQMEADAPLRRGLQAVSDEADAKDKERARRRGEIAKELYAQSREGLGRGQPLMKSVNKSQDVSWNRWSAQWSLHYARESVKPAIDGALWWCELLAVLPGPLLWVLWAFATRGGLSYRMAGIALVGRDGKSAGRFQCLWRALLVWLPPAGLLFLSFRLDDHFWRTWEMGADPEWLAWLSTIAWWSAWLLLAGYAALAMRNPRRGLHDYLAGTYLVLR